MEKKLSIRVTDNDFKLINDLRQKHNLNISKLVREMLLSIHAKENITKINKKQKQHGK